jgi:hypothetical protein
LNHFPKQVSEEENVMMASKALGLSLLGFFILGIVGSIFAFLPDIHNPSIIGLVTVWSLSLIISGSNFLNRLKPNLGARFLVLFNLTNLFLAVAIRGLAFFLSGWFWIVVLSVVYILVWVLPFINPQLAKYLNDVQYSLKPRLGKNRLCRFIMVFFFIVIGSVCSLLYALIGYRFWYFQSPGMLLVGILGTLLAIGGGQTFAYQIWKERQKPAQSLIKQAK